MYKLSFYHTSWNLIPVKLLSGSKWPFWESNSYVYTLSFYHTSWNLIPVKLLSGSKWPFWESNLLCVYILLLPYLLKFDSRKASFWLEMAVLGIKFPMCIHCRKASFWLKRAVLGIKFLCGYILLLPYLLKFDSRKAAFWLEMAVLGCFGNQISSVGRAPQNLQLLRIRAPNHQILLPTAKKVSVAQRTGSVNTPLNWATFCGNHFLSTYFNHF